MTDQNPPKPKPYTELVNSLDGLVSSFQGGAPFGANILPVNSTATMMLNNRGNLISNDRTTLSYLYVEHGLVQTLVDQPVDDAFRSGFEIKTAQISPDQIEELEKYLEEIEVMRQIIQVGRWGRLFGGGALLLLTDQDPAKEFKFDSLREFSRLEFRAVDMWELYTDEMLQPNNLDIGKETTYNFYGQPIHSSRILIFKGKEAPSWLRRQLRGWGMSEVERIVTSFNQYLKNNNVIFELLDEAKVDVYGIEGMNAALLSSEGTAKVSQRIQSANQIKNFVNAITMDVNDTYEQKQMSFSGLAEVLTQIRQGIASDLKMPITKLFGVSSTGFNSGEDDIENYNSMVEGEVRQKMKPMVAQVVQIACQKLFGMTLDDLEIEFNPLRILSAEQEENVKDRQFARNLLSYQNGLMTAQEFKEATNKDNLTSVELKENDDVHDTGMISEENNTFPTGDE